MTDTEASLESVTETARHVIANIGTVGVSLGGRIVPGCDHSFNLEENRMELGPVPCYLSAAKQNTVVHNALQGWVFTASQALGKFLPTRPPTLLPPLSGF